MKFVFFPVRKPKRFNIVARYHNPDLERLRKRRAEMGYEDSISHDEELRMKMRRRWQGVEPGNEIKGFGFSKRISFLIYAIFILGGVYLLFFTNFIEKLIMLFGVSK